MEGYTVSALKDPQTFNNLFSSIGKNLTEKFGDVILPELEANPDSCSFEFIIVNQNDILQELLHVHLSNKASLDIEMDNKLLRLASPLIAPVLTHNF